MATPVTLLGISAYYHDSAAALLRDGEIVAAASEERFTRKKGDAEFPAQATATAFPGVSTSAMRVGFRPLSTLKTLMPLLPLAVTARLLLAPLQVGAALRLGLRT